jgi:hypothetical protein
MKIEEMVPGQIYKWQRMGSNNWVWHLYKGNRKSIQLNLQFQPYSNIPGRIYDDGEQCCRGEWTELTWEEKGRIL